MDANNVVKPNSDRYVEAETVSEDSEISSFGNYTDVASEQVNPFLEGIVKVKDLIQELEESFRESNKINNNLILQCVLFRAENVNLANKIEQGRSLRAKIINGRCGSSLSCQHRVKSRILIASGSDLDKQLVPSDKIQQRFMIHDCREEIDVLHNTIGDLQKKLKERERKIENLCQKYLYLRANKKEMESDLKSKITSLEEQLHVTCDTLTEFQNETEADIEDSLSSAVDTYEALFWQEKLRCSKLMYERVRLHHEIQRLEDVIRTTQLTNDRENRRWPRVRRRWTKSQVDL